MSIRFVFKRFLSLRRHNPAPTKASDLQREIIHSLKSGLIFMIPTIALTLIGKHTPVTKIYWDIHEYNLWWYVGSFVLLFLWHDTYFYWTHRLMHHPRLYRHFHSLHHQSVYPTPWAALAFNSSEALVESLVFIIAIMVMPIHWSVLPLFNLLSILLNVHGHLGHDLFSRETLERAPLRWFNHPSTHGQHHLRHRGNYSLYLVFWDKIMGTWIGHIPLAGLASDNKKPHADHHNTGEKFDGESGRRSQPNEQEAC
jgi:lathosterol oxidase